MSEFNLIKCPQFLDNAITPPAKEIGITLGNIFYAIFSPINYTVEKLKIKQSDNLKKYQSDIESELKNIPEDKLIEPNISIIGPALEASKYYIQDDLIRRMFAKLIASSMNLDNSSKSHPAFVEIIKQLSPLDASNLKILSSRKYSPIVNYLVENDENHKLYYKTNVFLDNDSYDDIDLLSLSITNLSRLSLIKIDFSAYLTPDTIYNKFRNHPTYAILNDLAVKAKKQEMN